MKTGLAKMLSMFLVVLLTLGTTSLVWADVVAPDADLIMTGNQGTVNLGTVAPGTILTTKVSFTLVCDGNKHVDNGQTVKLSDSGHPTVPTEGSLSATSTEIGAISGWPSDGSQCSGLLSKGDNGDSTVTIKAPMVAGTYTYSVKYDSTLSPAGNNDSSSITGSVSASFTLTVVSNTAPVLNLPVDMTVEGNTIGGANVTYTATAVDAEDNPDPTPTCSPASGAFFPLGSTTVNCSVTDSGGLTTSGSFTVTVVDTTKPTIVAAATTNPNSVGWYNSDVTVHFTCSDVVGIAANACPADQVLNAEGASVSSVAKTVTDAAGNTSDPSNTVTVNIDKTKPTIAAAISSGTLGLNGWYTSDVTVHFTCTDTLSGIPDGTCPADQILGTEGASVSSVAKTVMDVAGNTSASSNVITVSIDKTKPTITATISSGTLGSNSWYTSDVTVHFTCTDNGSGIPSGACPDDQVLSAEGEAVSSTAQTVTDAAGNTSDPSNVVTVKIDKTNPTINATISDGTLGSNSWYTSDVTVHFTCTDYGSGIPDGACPVDKILSTEGASVSSVSQTVTDAAGNTSDPSNMVTVKIDKTAPTLDPTISPIPVLLNGTATATPNATDSVSSVASQSCGAVVTGSIGSKTLTCEATDQAGNYASVSVSYSVTYATGGLCMGGPGHTILQPINPDGTSVFKKGSTVPAKFRVCDANGASIGDPGVVSSFRLLKTTYGTVSGIDETVVSTTPDTTFRWSSTDQQWIFNINTKNLSASVTYYYLITLNDGSIIPFQFGLK